MSSEILLRNGRIFALASFGDDHPDSPFHCLGEGSSCTVLQAIVYADLG